MGYRFLAMSTSERTHQIPVDRFELAEKDYRSILSELEQFVGPTHRGPLPPVFAKVSHSLPVNVEWHPLHDHFCVDFDSEEMLSVQNGVSSG